MATRASCKSGDKQNICQYLVTSVPSEISEEYGNKLLEQYVDVFMSVLGKLGILFEEKGFGRLDLYTMFRGFMFNCHVASYSND